MSEFTALCARKATCIVCGQPFDDIHRKQGHAAPSIAKAMKDYRDGLRRGDEDGLYGKVMGESILANIAKVSQAFVIAYREASLKALDMYTDHSRYDDFDD